MAADSATLKKIAEGREAEVFEWEDGAVLKLFRSDAWASGIEQESVAMNAVCTAGGPAPRARGMVRVSDRPGLVIDRVYGPDMLSLIASKPWLVWRLGRQLGETHAALHKTSAPAELPALKDRFRTRIERESRSAPELAHLASFALACLDAMPDGDRVCHGDFHPGNVLIEDGRPVVIDWPNATRGDPTADLARTLMTIRMGALPPGTPIVIRAGARFARGLLRAAYVRAYRRAHPIDKDLLARWEVPVAANRLCEGIEEERATLIAMLERAYAARR